MGSKNVLSESVSNRENIPVKFEIEDHLEEQHAPLHKRCKVSNLSLNIIFLISISTFLICLLILVLGFCHLLIRILDNAIILEV
jgi:hypothetical protein